MPSYYYHLKFELYPTPDPATGPNQEAINNNQIWVPSQGSDIFDSLPAHTRAPETATILPPSRKRATEHPRRAVGASTSGGSQYPASSSSPSSAVIDCGSRRATAAQRQQQQQQQQRQRQDNSADRNLVFLSERQWRARSKSLPTPRFTAGIGPRTARRDWRFGPLRIESFDLADRGKQVGSGGAPGGPMEQGGETHATPAASLGPNLGGPGQATKARYVPLETKNTEIGWGVVHLYREADGSYGPDARPPRIDTVGSDGAQDGEEASGSAPADEGCTILCIPSVPSYLSPSDFLGFVGEKWRGGVSHYRMIMTSKMNRYMVLMKFRDAERAKQWRKAFDGRVFNSIESEICHVTFIKSITVETPTLPTRNHNNNHNNHNSNNIGSKNSASNRPEDGVDPYNRTSSAVAHSLKPFPPPTPNLIELPTCTVCLERMDDTAGLMTILCQHVFHCTCLQTWKGSGCPVCRATNPSLVTAGPGSSYDYDNNYNDNNNNNYNYDVYDRDNPYQKPFGSGVSNLCSVCDCASDLWICLICGYVGCGRYKGGHAKDHWKETAHSFSLELETQHVWDYAGDMWVHRLIRDKGDGKVVELPSNDDTASGGGGGGGGLGGGGGGGGDGERYAVGEEDDVVPRAKLDSIGMEYTHLLTSQLESQRVYFEEMVNKAADKAAKAAATAESASAQARGALAELSSLRAEYRTLKEETIPSLEKDLSRERNRANKSTELARSLGKSLQEEKKVGEGLMERVEHVNKELEATKKRMEELRVESEDLKETNRDLTMFISGQEKLKELEGEGKVEHDELEGGKVSVPEEKRQGKGKGKTKR